MAEKDRFRKRQFKLSLTEQEFQILEQNSFELKITKSEFIRHIIVYGRLTQNIASMDEATERIYIDLVNEMNHIGNNINQIAYLCNKKQCVEETDIKILKNEMIDLLKRIIEEIRRIDKR